MNADLIKSILTVIAAALPLIILVITIVRSRPKSSDRAIDSPSLKILKITREAIHTDILRIVLYLLINSIGFLIIFFIFLTIYSALLQYLFQILFQFLLPINRIEILTNVYIISIILQIIIIFIYLLNILIPLFFEKTRTYFLFSDLDILLESDYHYIVNKCHETLRIMDFKLTRVDESNGELEAFQFRFLRLPLGFSWNIITVTVKKAKGEFLKNSTETVKRNYIVTVTCRTGPLKNVLESSRIKNNFFDVLISKPKNEVAQTENKADVTTDIDD